MKATKKHIHDLEHILDLLTRADLYIDKAEGLAFETECPNGVDYTIRNEALSVDNDHTVTQPLHLTKHNKNGSPLVFIKKAIRNLHRTIEGVK